MIRPILQVPDARLVSPSITVKHMGPEERALAIDLLDTMRSHDAAGLAAPQIGSSVRMIALRPIPHTEFVFDILVNPEIVSRSKQTMIEREGCLSIGGGKVFFPIERPVYIFVKFQTTDRRLESFGVGGFGARVIQHEVDHLDGKLISTWNFNE